MAAPAGKGPSSTTPSLTFSSTLSPEEDEKFMHFIQRWLKKTSCTHGSFEVEDILATDASHIFLKRFRPKTHRLITCHPIAFSKRSFKYQFRVLPGPWAKVLIKDVDPTWIKGPLYRPDGTFEDWGGICELWMFTDQRVNREGWLASKGEEKKGPSVEEMDATFLSGDLGLVFEKSEFGTPMDFVAPLNKLYTRNRQELGPFVYVHMISKKEMNNLSRKFI